MWASQGQVEVFDGQDLAEQWLGNTQMSSVVALGYAWQRGLIPVGLSALEQAIRLNNEAVQANLMALMVVRLAADDPGALSV